MVELILHPTLNKYDTCKEFATDFTFTKNDLIITNRDIFDPHFKDIAQDAHVIFEEEYGSGEPTNKKIEAICEDVKTMGEHTRVFGIGGGAVMDISKLFALEKLQPVDDLYDKKFPPVKKRELILIPTTCGTGSEVTSISVLLFPERNMKIGLPAPELFADKAILIPELLHSLPYIPFAGSAIDALVHAIESALSPKATCYTKLFSYKAMDMILNGFKAIIADGEKARIPLSEDFLVASNFAGIAFGTAGCATVHAMSFPLGGTFHVPHGEANYTLLNGVLNTYKQVDNTGELIVLQKHLAKLLNCSEAAAFEELDILLNQIMPRKTLKDYGVTQEVISTWIVDVPKTQQRLLVNSFCDMTEDLMQTIYTDLL